MIDMNWRGQWRRFRNSSLEYETYTKGDVVGHFGVAYIALEDVTGRVDPTTNSQNTIHRSWEVIVGLHSVIDGGHFQKA